MQVGEAFVTVRPDTRQFGPELQRGVESSGRQAASGLSQALTAGIAVAGFSKVVGAASDLTEAANKVNATFGQSSAQVEDFASTSAQSLGIAESAALDLAGGLGSMLIPLGISQEEAANMSTTMLTLAADMGSFNNQDPTEMLERIRSGLAGESEPLRQFGANLSEARVQQFAWQEGIAESGVALTEQQKVMARYGLLLQDTSIQQGDFAATSDEAANAQRIAAATAQDSAASIGSNFLPVYKQAVAAVTALAGAFGSLPGPLQTAAVIFAGFAAFKGPVTGAFSAIAEGARLAAARFKEAGGGARGFASFLSPGALGTAGAVAALAILTNGLAENARRAKEAEDRMKALSDAFAEGGAGAAGDTLLTQIQDQVPEAVDALNTAGVSTRDLVDAAQEGDAALEGMVHQIQEAGGLSQLSAIELGMLAQASGDAAQTAATLGDAQAANADAAAANTGSIQDQADALTEVADSADAAHDAMNALFGVQMSLDDATINLQQAIDDTRQSINDNGRSTDLSTQRGRDNVSALRDQGTAIRDYLVALRASGASTREVTQAQAFLTGGLRRTAGQTDMTRGRTDALIGTYAKVPRQISSQMTLAATANVSAALGALSGLEGRILAVARAYNQADLNRAQALASLNQGPESFGGGGGAAESFGGGGGGFPTGHTVNVNVAGNVIGDVDRFADEIAYRAAEKIARTGAF